MRRTTLARLSGIAPLMALIACSGTWIDDPRNFKRVFDFEKPQDVAVIHSYYWKSPHWTVEYRYYIALQGPRKFADGLTDASLMTPASAKPSTIESCGEPRPEWFVPKPLNNYEAWLPKNNTGYRVFRDKQDGTLFICDQRL